MTDPMFPNRPTHPDFWAMSAVVIDLDAKADTAPTRAFGDAAVGAVDERSLSYMAMQRGIRAARILGQDTDIATALAATLGASWAEGVIVGIELERRRQSGQPQSREGRPS